MIGSITSNDLVQQARTATVEATALAVRVATIEDDIEGVKAATARARLNAARAGLPVSQAAPARHLELDSLLAERDELPELHLAARMRAAELGIAAAAAAVRETAPRAQQAQAELEPLEAAAAEAQQRATAAAAVLSQLQGEMWIAREHGRVQEKLLQSIEEEGPRPLV